MMGDDDGGGAAASIGSDSSSFGDCDDDTIYVIFGRGNGET